MPAVAAVIPLNRFVDADGMGPEDIIIRGPEEQKAFEELKKSVAGQLNLSKDANGKISYTQTDPKAPINADVT